MTEPVIASWGHPLFRPPNAGAPAMAERPPLLDWKSVDDVLLSAARGGAANVILMLCAVDAELIAHQEYVLQEPFLNVAIAIGHADRSVGITADGSLLDAKRAAFDQLVTDARNALGRGHIADALVAVAAHLDRIVPRRFQPPPVR